MIIARYLVMGFLAHAGATLLILLTLYLLFDLVEVYRLIDASGGGFPLVLRYLVDRSASALWHVLPAAVLLGLFLSLGALARRGELIAIAAAGIGPVVPTAALVAAALLASTATWVVGDVWMPEANGRIADLFRSALHPKQSRASRRQDRWVRTGDRLVHLQKLGATPGQVGKVTVFELGPRFRPHQRIDAPRMRWTSHGWVLEDATIRGLEPLRRPVKRSALPLRLGLTPRQLRAGLSSPEVLAGRELAELVRWRQERGQDTAGLELALAQRRSWPLLPIFFALLAVPLALRPRRGGGILLSMGLAFAVGAGFAALVFVTQALARAGAIPPAAAGWMPTLTAGAGGALLTLRVLWKRRPG